MLFLNKYWKLLLGLVIALALAIGSFYYGRQSAKPQIIVQEKVIEKIVTIEKKVKDTKKDTHTVIVKEPDGTVTTTIIENEHTQSEESLSTSHETQTETTSRPVAKLSKYRFGGFIETNPVDLWTGESEPPTYGITASTRLFSSVWLDASFNIKTQSATLGLSVEL